MKTKHLRALAFAAALLTAASAVTANAATASSREGGSLVKDFRQLTEEISTAQQAAQRLVSTSGTTAARDTLNTISDALDSAEDARAAELYAAELKAGRGPEYWGRQRQEFAQKEQDFLALFDRVQRIYREARRARADGKPDSSTDRLDELARVLAADNSNAASTRMGTTLVAAKKDRDEKLKLLVAKYNRTSVYLTDDVANLSDGVLGDVLSNVIEKAVEMGDAAASAHRAESFLAAFPDTVRDRAKQKTDPRTQTASNSTSSTKLF